MSTNEDYLGRPLLIAGNTNTHNNDNNNNSNHYHNNDEESETTVNVVDDDDDDDDFSCSRDLLKKNKGDHDADIADRGVANGAKLNSRIVEGCPGCALQQRKLSSSPDAPISELLFVAVTVLCNALPISSLFPFIYFMVEDLNVAETETQIAYYAGFIGSAFMVGRFVASTPMGLVADKYGRKPVMLMGTASIIIFNTLFGFSTTYWMALLSRFLLGCNGLLGTIRAYVSEICSAEQQALGMSLVGTMWGVGLIIGPAIGGYLARPAISYPGLFPSGSIFSEFPYALPCLCISAFAVLPMVASFWAPESLHKHPVLIKTSSKKQIDEKPIWKNWGLISAITLYCIWSLHDMAYTEIFSLWAVSPIKLGGLGMTTSDVGIILAISGGALLFFQLLVYPRVQHFLGAILTSRISAILSVPLVAIYPLIAELTSAWLWIVVITASILKNVLSVAVMTASFILINNSVPSTQRGIANGVSMAFMSLFKAVGPACAGALLSWAETRLDASFLPGTWMVFTLLAVVCFITIAVTFEPILPRSLEKPKSEDIGGVIERHSSFTI